jgi:hypothetical protein
MKRREMLPGLGVNPVLATAARTASAGSHRSTDDASALTIGIVGMPMTPNFISPVSN